MPSLNPPLTKDDFTNSRWQDVVNSSERKDCLTYSNAFWKKAQEAIEAGNVREQAVFEILAAVSSTAIKPDLTEEFFAEVFQNLTDEHLDFLSEIASDVSDLELQARVSDPWDKFAGMFKDDPLFNEFVEDMAAYRCELDAEVAG